MKTCVLGKDLTVSAVSLGCMGFTHAYGTAMRFRSSGSPLYGLVSKVYGRR